MFLTDSSGNDIQDLVLEVQYRNQPFSLLPILDFAVQEVPRGVSASRILHSGRSTMLNCCRDQRTIERQNLPKISGS